MKKSNRFLAKRLKYIENLNLTLSREGKLKHLLSLCKLPYDPVYLIATSSNYIYRAVLVEDENCLNKIERIAYNPNPQRISRANLPHQAIAYYACDYDVAILESCHDCLKKTKQRTFELIVSKWKIEKDLSLQLICNSKKFQMAGTDIKYYYEQIKKDRFSTNGSKKKYIRNWFLKSRFIAELFAKENDSEMDYFITAYYTKKLFQQTSIQGLIYPSVQYLYKGFNYAFLPSLWNEGYFKLMEVTHYFVKFKTINTRDYPQIKLLRTTNNFDGNIIRW